MANLTESHDVRKYIKVVKTMCKKGWRKGRPTTFVSLKEEAFSALFIETMRGLGCEYEDRTQTEDE